MARFLRTSWLLALLLLLHPWAAVAQSDPVEIVFLDVGQGDAVVIRAPEGQTALIDAGPGVDLSASLGQLGIDQLDLVIATHPHADHIGGVGQLLQAIPVRFYMDNGLPHTTATYLGVMRTLRARSEIIYLDAAPRALALGSVDIHVLPLPEHPSSNPNDHSIGLVIEHGAFRAFLSGDSERPELTHFLQAAAVPDVTLLKAPHHGSDDAVSEAFLSAARPEVVVISVGYANRYGHPGIAALSTYPRHAREMYRTDVHGQVTVLGFDDGTYRVRLEETAGASVRAGGTAVLYTGRGMSDGSSFFMGSGSAVWNNDGDTATLHDRSGRVVARHVY